MEKKFRLQYDGQQVLQSDLNTLGDSAGLADDRVFAELFRITPGNGTTVYKGVLPYGTSAASDPAMVKPLGSTGSVAVLAFRAFIGSRTSMLVDPTKSWQDVRSALCIPASAVNGYQTVVQLTANASGNPRWDLIYAAVTIDTPATPVTRKVKDPSSSVVSSVSASPFLVTTCTLAVVAGVTNVAPVWPSAPTDADPVYYIPIAYVRVPTGFTAASIVPPSDIAIVAPSMHLAKETGANSTSIASSQSALTTTAQFNWGAAGGRGDVWVPPAVGGQESVWCMIDLISSLTAQHSHQSVGIIDARDWRNRLCTVTAAFQASPAIAAWQSTAPGVPGNVFPHGALTTRGFAAASNRIVTSMANTMVDDQYLIVGTSVLLYVTNAQTTQMAAGTTIALYVDQADGTLRLFYSGLPTCKFNVRIDFSAPFSNVR